MKKKKILKIEQVWHQPCDRWIYIEHYSDLTIGLNYCQGNNYEHFTVNYCFVDKGLTEFYEVMCESYRYEKVATGAIRFISKVMWTYHNAIILHDENIGYSRKKQVVIHKSN